MCELRAIYAQFTRNHTRFYGLYILCIYSRNAQMMRAGIYSSLFLCSSCIIRSLSAIVFLSISFSLRSIVSSSTCGGVVCCSCSIREDRDMLIVSATACSVASDSSFTRSLWLTACRDNPICSLRSASDILYSLRSALRFLFIG